MFDGKFYTTMVALVVAVFAICNLKDKVVTNEGFWGNPSMTYKVERVMANSPQAAAKGDFYSVPGTFQSMLSPRFSNTDYNAAIRYNLPSRENLAMPCEPMTFGNMASDGQCGRGSGPVNCGKGGHAQDIRESFETEVQQYPEAMDMLPVGDMTTLNAQGESEQPIVYDRLVYANRQSNLRNQGDPIRGDLPIVPCAAEWFRPSVRPNIDLQQGALSVMAGPNNESNIAMAQLIATTSGEDTFGGVSMSSMKSVDTSGALSGVNVQAFP